MKTLTPRGVLMPFVLGLPLALAAAPAHAGWTPGGLPLERPAPARASGIPRVGPDGQGGTYVVWSEADTLGALAFRVHRLTAAGDPPPGWTTSGGRAGAVLDIGSTPGVIPDGAGGAYIYWAGSTGPARVLRIDSDGAVNSGWPAFGIPVAPAAQKNLVATEDGAGGILLAWERSTSGLPPEIVLQRFRADGSRPAGFPATGLPITSLSSSLATSRRPRLVRDPGRGFWVSYSSLTVDPMLATSKYMFTHLDTTALPTPGPPAGGRALSVPAGEVGTLPPYAPVALAIDGSGGAFAFTLGGNGVVRAFHVAPSLGEDAAWPAGGQVLASGAGWPSVHFAEDDQPWPIAAGDPGGSAYVGWRSNTHMLLHACRVNRDGTIAAGWSSAPVVAGEMSTSFVADPGGLFAASLAWIDCPHFDCYGPLKIVRMNVAGDVAPGWPGPSPTPLSAPGTTLAYGGPGSVSALAADGLGGVVVTWVDDPDTFAMRFIVTGPAGVPPAAGPGGLTLRAYFEPGVGVRVSFAFGEPGDARLELFDVAGRRRVVAHPGVASGEVTLLEADTLPSGLWFVRLVTPTRTRTVKVMIAR